MKPALLVIGPSRSGSSALAGVLVRLGATAPATLMPAGKGNERGHYESDRLMRLNDEVLAAHGLTYWDPLAIPPGWFGSGEAGIFAGRIAEALVGEFGDGPLPVIKDPRLCRIGPLYRDALARLGWEGRAIIPLRHPGAAAASLVARDGTLAETAELLQVRELLGAEAQTRGMRRAWVRYEALLADWRGTMDGLAAALGIAWPVAAPVVDDFLEPGMRHQDTATSGVLAERLHGFAAHGDGPGLQAGFDLVAGVLAEHDRLLAPWLRAAPSQAAVAQLSRAHAETLAARDAALAACAADLAKLKASTSWRITAPLRAVMHLLRGSGG